MGKLNFFEAFEKQLKWTAEKPVTVTNLLNIRDYTEKTRPNRTYTLHNHITQSTKPIIECILRI